MFPHTQQHSWQAFQNEPALIMHHVQLLNSVELLSQNKSDSLGQAETKCHWNGVQMQKKCESRCVTADDHAEMIHRFKGLSTKSLITAMFKIPSCKTP